MLRAVFRWEGLAKPVQVILRRHRPNVRCHDLRLLPTGERDAALERAVALDAAGAFDLREVPFRITLLCVSDKRWTMLKTFHHILYNDFSTRVVLNQDPFGIRQFFGSSRPSVVKACAGGMHASG